MAVVHSTCEGCGVEFSYDFTTGRKKRYCSKKCWKTKYAPHPRKRGVCTVDGCAYPHKSKGYCNFHYRRFIRTGSADGNQFFCVVCGKATGSQRALKYCSNACKIKDFKSKNPENLRKYALTLRDKQEKLPKFTKVSRCTCGHCGKQFYAPRKRKYCSNECISASRSTTDWSELICQCCGVGFAADKRNGAPPRYCQVCDQVVKEKHHRSAQRASKARRRALLKASCVVSFDPFDVFDRDKWRCKLCGVRTPKMKRGTHDDDAPELDHIIPLSKGGSHSRENTQCTCRKCNAAKSDRPLGQLLIFG